MQPDNLGTYLVQLRQTRGISPTQLARRAQISRATLYNWESGRFQPRLQELEAALEVLTTSSQERELALALMPSPRAQKQLLPTDDLSDLMPQGGELLRALRIRQDWTQGQAAARVDVNQTTIARWERGESWPQQELLQRYCYLLRAREEELTALLPGPFAFPNRNFFPGTVTLDSITASLERLPARLNHPDYYPLGDLLFLSLQAQVFPLAQKSEEARLLLARILLDRAGYLGERFLPAEAGRVAELAMPLVPRQGEQWNALRLKTEMYWMVWKYPLRTHAQKLRPWRDRVLPLRAWIWVRGQMAASLIDQRENEAALEIDRESLARTMEVGTPGMIQHRSNLYAENLVAVGRAAEAIDMLTIGDTMSPALKLRTKLTQSEAYLAVGNRARAHDLLNEAYTDNGVLNISYYLPQMQALAARL